MHKYNTSQKEQSTYDCLHYKLSVKASCITNGSLNSTQADTKGTLVHNNIKEE